MERAVERGLQRRSVEQVRRVGIDEKSFGKGQSYVSVMTDLDVARVLDVVEDRTQQATDELWLKLPENQRKQVLGVALGMWAPFLASRREGKSRGAPFRATVCEGRSDSRQGRTDR